MPSQPWRQKFLALENIGRQASTEKQSSNASFNFGRHRERTIHMWKYGARECASHPIHLLEL